MHAPYTIYFTLFEQKNQPFLFYEGADVQNLIKKNVQTRLDNCQTLPDNFGGELIINKKHLKAKDKTVQKMSRDGLVEQNLVTGEKQRITNRAQDFSLKEPAARHPPTQATAKKHKPRAAPETTSSGHSSPVTVKSAIKQSEPMNKPLSPAGTPTPGDASPVKYTRESKLRHAEAKVTTTEKKLDAVRKKQPHKKRLISELTVDEKTQTVKRRLHFNDTPTPAKSRRFDNGTKIAGGMVAHKVHRKMYQVEDNIGVKAAHRTEIAGETALRTVSLYRRTRPQRLARKTVRLEKQAATARANLRFEKAVKKNPELQKQGIIRKYLQKRKLRKQYIKQAQKKAKQAAKKARQAEKGTEKVIAFVAKHPILSLIMGLVLLFVMLFQSCFGNCMSTLKGQRGVFVFVGKEVMERARKPSLIGQLKKNAEKLAAEKPAQNRTAIKKKCEEL